MILEFSREQFEEWLLYCDPLDPRHPHMSRMADMAKPYIGGMDERSRDAFLEFALDFAWAARYNFNQQYESRYKLWARCLRAAALSRDKWLISVATLPGVYVKRWVLGRRLGEV